LGAEAIPMSHQPWGPSASCFPVPHLNLFPGCWGCTCIFFLPSCLGVRQFSFSLWLPFGCISIENKFGPCNNGDWKNLLVELAVIFFKKNYHSWGDRKVLVIKIMTIETF
jgi:hypothetical protein